MPMLAFFTDVEDNKTFASGAWYSKLYVTDNGFDAAKFIGTVMHSWMYDQKRKTLTLRPDPLMQRGLFDVLGRQEHTLILSQLLNSFWVEVRYNYQMGLLMDAHNQILKICWVWPTQDSDNALMLTQAWEMFRKETPQVAHIQFEIESY